MSDNKTETEEKPDNVPWIEKYEPRKMDDIFGNEQIINKLKNMIKNKNMTNIILSGPSGIGKTRSTSVMAHEILKENVVNGLLELNGSEDRGINIVRENIKSFTKKKLVLEQGIYKIIILDEADNITVNSQQALRRIIEQSSNNTRFIFTCNDVGKIIDALQSRCTVLTMVSLKDKDIYKMLELICLKEGVEYNKTGLDKIASISNGDMRNAINNLQNTYFCFKKISKKNVEEICDDMHKDTLKLLIKSCVKSDVNVACECVKTIFESGYSPDDTINMIYETIKTTNLLTELQKIKYIKHVASTNIILNEGCTSLLQLYGLMAHFCTIDLSEEEDLEARPRIPKNKK
jgi:replication factor C subunit 2/4